MDVIGNIDKIDKLILACLIENARMSYTDIAKKLNVSAGTIHGRVKKLEKRKIIIGANLKINYETVGYMFTAYVGVILGRTIESEKIIEKMILIPEVTVASVISGQYGILCKIRCKNTKHAKNIIYKISNINGVLRTESMISLEESINDKERLFKSIFET
ncbi:winged helix-turn-helix transcriptional regulator [Vicingaceae bacterium]|nr:winged helix-turn-helix transcriptional regulator [Vicingaceae bacterium]MDB9964164.1 winged helix-turn-helix transcriptional regulator [Vicingaceae bacterium]